MEKELPKRKSGTRWGLVMLLIVIGIIWVMSAGSSNSSQGTDVTTPVSNITPTQNKPMSSFGDGTFIVNTDIRPGTYRSSGGENCYYERLKGFGGTTDDIIANDNTNLPAIVAIASTDKGFTSSKCGMWTKLSESLNTSSKSTSTKKTAPSAQSSSVPVTTQSQANTPSTGATTNSSVIVATPPSASPASWHTVQTFSGQTQKNTSPFTIQGSQWRITWQETGDGYFGADAQSPDGGGNFGYCSIANLSGSGSDVTYCYKPGTYYLWVNTANSWTMTVEDYY